MIDAYVDGRPMPRSSSALDERRLGVARRRGRLVALRLERERVERVALAAAVGSRRSSSSARALLVAPLLVRGEEAAEGDHRAGGAELGVLAGARRPRRAGRETVWPCASSICDATVRIQISS